MIMETNNSFFDRYNTWVKNSIGLRVFTIAFLILILLIPISMVEDLIREREGRQEEATSEVSQKWGEQQTISGLILTIPFYTYTKYIEDDKTEKLIKKKQYAHFLPTELNIDGKLLPETRYRGIYEVVVYKSDVKLSGYFDKPDFKKLNIPEKDVEWSQSSISLGLSDLRGIQNSVVLNWNAADFPFEPGIKTIDVISTGISTTVPLNANDSLGYKFDVDVNFNGSSSLNFIPLGTTTKISIQSDWKSPSFDGAFLPDHREINKDGFVAEWKVLHLNRSYPQSFVGATQEVQTSEFGVTLIMPVDEYQKSMRSVKYAVMFITLTFLIFFFAQIMNRVRIHPIQYLIVGLALCLFFTLVVALSEHIPFKYSYLIGSAAIISMITAYSISMLKNSTLTKLLAGILIVIYGFIYIVIQLQDYSLLIGSIGLFVILGIIMYLSRNIDWYNIAKEE